MTATTYNSASLAERVAGLLTDAFAIEGEEDVEVFVVRPRTVAVLSGDDVFTLTVSKKRPVGNGREVQP